MATNAQINANQANAQHSTGPKSAEGKARVAQNAIRHGLTAKHLVVREDDREEFEALRDQLLQEYAPQGATETVVFNELVHAAWNLARFRRIEGEASLGTIDDFTDPRPPPSSTGSAATRPAASAPSTARSRRCARCKPTAPSGT